MLATALLVLPPMVTRLIQVLARLAGLESPSLRVSFALGQLLTIGAALLLARRRRDDAQPFLVLTALFLMQIASFVVLAPNTGWRAMLAAFGASPALPSTMAAAALSLGTLVLAWRRVPARPRPAMGQRIVLEPAKP